jgi:hypothetical protein
VAISSRRFGFFLSPKITGKSHLRIMGRWNYFKAWGDYYIQNDSQPQNNKDIIGITVGKRFTPSA